MNGNHRIPSPFMVTIQHFSPPFLNRLETAANRRRGSTAQAEMEHVNAQAEQRGSRRPRPVASSDALSELNAAAPNLAIHAYASAIASHRRFARSGFHARLRSHSRPPLFKSLNISSIRMRTPCSLPYNSGQLAAGHRGSARSQSHKRSAQRSIQPDFLNALSMRRQDIPVASDSAVSCAQPARDFPQTTVSCRRR